MSTSTPLAERVITAKDLTADAIKVGSLASELPAPSRFANYNADARHMVGQLYGPNTLDEYLTAVSAEFDPATGKTRVGFAYGDHSIHKATLDALAGQVSQL